MCKPNNTTTFITFIPVLTLLQDLLLSTYDSDIVWNNSKYFKGDKNGELYIYKIDYTVVCASRQKNKKTRKNI